LQKKILLCRTLQVPICTQKYTCGSLTCMVSILWLQNITSCLLINAYHEFLKTLLNEHSLLLVK
jgi:hypothetical protein